MRKTLLITLSVFLAVPVSPASTRQDALDITLSPILGSIVQRYWPEHAKHPNRPDFILVQNAHSSLYAQHAISGLLRQLKWQGLMPDRIAVEGAVGPVDIHKIQKHPDANERRITADEMVRQGQISGVMHFVISEGEGDLYGIENADLYQSSVEMFRRSYWARMELGKELDKLDAALALLLRTESAFSPRVALLTQDVQILRSLVNERLVADDIQPITNRAVSAVDHLKDLLPEKTSHLMDAVSASVDFYALALLRDDALFKRSMRLRQIDHQTTTVIVCGGFHTSGLTKRIKAKGYSFIVVKPQVGAVSGEDDRQYVERIMGHPVVVGEPTSMEEIAVIPDPSETSTLKKSDILLLSKELRQKIPLIQFSASPLHDIFTAMDLPWLGPAVKFALINERSEMLAPVALTSKNTHSDPVY